MTKFNVFSKLLAAIIAKNYEKFFVKNQKYGAKRLIVVIDHKRYVVQTIIIQKLKVKLCRIGNC